MKWAPTVPTPISADVLDRLLVAEEVSHLGVPTLDAMLYVDPPVEV
jgi:hypothetical protein